MQIESSTAASDRVAVPHFNAIRDGGAPISSCVLTPNKGVKELHIFWFTSCYGILCASLCTQSAIEIRAQPIAISGMAIFGRANKPFANDFAICAIPG